MFAKKERVSTLESRHANTGSVPLPAPQPLISGRDDVLFLALFLGFLAEAAPRFIRGTRALDPVPRLQCQPCKGLYASDGTAPLTGPPPSRSINLSPVFAAARSPDGPGRGWIRSGGPGMGYDMTSGPISLPALSTTGTERSCTSDSVAVEYCMDWVSMSPGLCSSHGCHLHMSETCRKALQPPKP